MEYITSIFNYQRYLPMNTGVEGGETAIKLARKWGYEKKNVKENKAVNLFSENNFWGRTIAAVSSSNNKKCYNNYGSYTDGFELIEYNNLNKLEKKFKSNPNIVSFMLEPIQGEAGIIIPDNGYLKNVKKLCEKYNVLMIADEVQTGLGRTGKLLACDYENIKPDILILGKSLSGVISRTKLFWPSRAKPWLASSPGYQVGCSMVCIRKCRRTFWPASVANACKYILSSSSISS